MADDVQGGSPKTEPSHVETKEDAETRATRRELKQSSISDEVPASSVADTTVSSQDTSARPDTPADAQSDDLREKIASPKKKRAHDQLEGDKVTEENDANSVASSDSARDRASRTEPEKKRHRDGDSETDSKSDEAAKSTKPDPKAPTEGGDKKQTSTSAFSTSAFGKLSASASPFASLGGSNGSGFGGGGAPKLSSFASPAPPPAQPSVAPKLSFGGSNSASPFAGLSSGANGFGNPLAGSTFGSVFGVAKPLGSFAAPGAGVLKKDKPAKPFGAPDSDAENDEENDKADDEAQSEEAERAASPEKESEEKKRLRLQKVAVDDGEKGEATVLSVRAKLFYHDKETGWKERGAGMLKINVPQSCVDYDDAGVAIPGSFDASGLEDDEESGESGKPKVVRLLMRQDQTHRVILNTGIVPAMQFQEKESLKYVGILFTAFEGPEATPVNITMRMTAANAKNFMNEIGTIQRELQNN